LATKIRQDAVGSYDPKTLDTVEREIKAALGKEYFVDGAGVYLRKAKGKFERVSEISAPDLKTLLPQGIESQMHTIQMVVAGGGLPINFYYGPRESEIGSAEEFSRHVQQGMKLLLTFIAGNARLNRRELPLEKFIIEGKPKALREAEAERASGRDE